MEKLGPDSGFRFIHKPLSGPSFLFTLAHIKNPAPL